MRSRTSSSPCLTLTICRSLRKVGLVDRIAPLLHVFTALPLSRRMHLFQQAPEIGSFIGPKSNRRVSHLDEQNVFPLGILQKRKWTRRAYGPEVVRLPPRRSSGRLK